MVLVLNERRKTKKEKERECVWAWGEKKREKGRVSRVDLGFWRVLEGFDPNRVDGETRSAFLYALRGGSTACDEVRFRRSTFR